ncbi:DUF1731 domain-containing protein [Flavobacterium sp. xlx-214]|uniref:NAD-dependent epimerase/dehydratase family protein n=1 Tax=unclassified Flavobacterium TaxID=196869 RepID=UPI0013D4E94C|nr:MULTISPECIES: NAD-dependent epimerase/dehydratase family protein [unclassified Flavobacterium]MBA5791599.1 DUF1731 domain-containing protein [Flavobacterium sp. xlx-221]QMI82846.1 DUF1731 domain-containing protein [Flavobacterium sp. xlx-214]
MKQTVLITGANSFIAKHIIPILEKDYNIKLLTRSPKAENEFTWDVHSKTIDPKALDGVNYIIHLAGSKLNDGTPLTEERKKMVYESRIGASDFLRDELKKRQQKITAFVSASAIGYYGYQDNTFEIDENGKKGIGFAADLSEDWEKAADRFKEDGTAKHVSKIRVSLVLGNESGIFPIYESLVKNNPTIIFQEGHNSVPWNHVEDMAGIFAFAVQHKLDGVYNSVAPVPASQQDIYKAISNELHLNKTEDIMPFNGQHLVSNKIQNAGYHFKFPSIQEAVQNLYK